MILRALFFVVAVLQATILVAPHFVGKQAENTVRTQIETLSSYPGYITHVEQYERGWWSSHVVWSVRIDPGLVPVDENELTGGILGKDNLLMRVKMRLDHGPLLPQNGLTLGWVGVHGYWDTSTSPVLEALRTSLSLNQLFDFEGVVDLHGNQSITGEVPAFRETIAASKPLLVDFGGFNFRLDSTLENHLVFKGSLPWFRLSTENQSLISVSQLQVGGEGELAGEWSWIGKSRLNMDELEIAGNTSLMMQGITMLSDSRLDVDDTLTAKVDYRINGIAFDNEKLSDFEMGLMFERISLYAINEYVDFINQMSINTDDHLQIQMELSSLVQRLLPEMLSRSPAISITSLGFKWNERDINLQGQVRFNGENFVPPVHFYDLGFWKERLHIIASMQVDKPLAEDIAELILNEQLSKTLAENPEVSDAQIRQMASMQADSTLAVLTQQRQLIQTQYGYKANFLLERGQASLNGQPVAFLP